MIRIDRVRYRLLWRRKLGRDVSLSDTIDTPFCGIHQCPVPTELYLSRNCQQLRRYKVTNTAWSLSMRSSSLRESLPPFVDEKQRRESSRLDSIPNDLSEVVNKVLTFIELNHEDKNIRERYIRNFELARRRPLDDIDSCSAEGVDRTTEAGSGINGINGHDMKLNGHHLSFDEMVSDLSISNNNFRLDNVYEESLSVANDLNGLNGSHDISRGLVGPGDYSNSKAYDRNIHNTKRDFEVPGSTDLSPFDSIRTMYRQGYVKSASTSDSGEIAIYHALKNDFQSGGHIEEVRSLTSKSDPIPFTNVEALLAQQTTEKQKTDTDRPQADYVESLNLNCVAGVFNVDERSSSSESSLLNAFDNLEPGMDIPLEENLSQRESLGDRHLIADFNSFVEQKEHVNSFSLNGSHDDVSHSMEYESKYEYHHNGVNGYHNNAHKANGYNVGPVSDQFSVDSEIGLDSLRKSASDALFVSKPLEAQELSTWFHSDFLDNNSVFGEQTAGSVVSEAEQARTEALFEAIILLRTLTEDHWNCFDLGDSHTLSLSEETSESSLHDSESMQLNSRRTVDILSDLLSNDTLSSDEQLTTADYNFSLARIAVATDVALDDILALLMQTHKQMTELYVAGFPNTRPNSVTHEILLLALVRRFSAFHNAIDLVTALSKSPHFTWSPSSLLVASELCKRKDHLKMSREIMKDLRKWNASQFVIPKRVFHNLIKVYKDNDARKDAIDMLRLGLKQASGKSDRHLDEIFVNTIKWPTMSRLSGFIDNSSVIADILLLLENETVYVAGIPVWKELIRRSALGATKIPSRWEYVAKSFHYLSVAAPYYCPDHHLLQQGLEASGALAKPHLACELLRRAIVHYTPSPLLVIENPLLRRPHVSFQHFVDGISTCVKANDMKACEKILHIAKSITMNHANIRSLYVLALKGYASSGDVDKTVKILETMISEKLTPGEDCYGALFYAFAISSHLDAARELLQDMESGAIGVPPGPTCYDGFILACARNGAWDDVLAAFETMKILDVSVSSSSNHGILLAAAKIGGRNEVKKYVESFVSSNSQLFGDGVLLASRILLDGIILRSGDDMDDVSLDTIRERLRVFSQQNAPHQLNCLRLIRSIRMAESEESRYNEIETVKKQKFLSRSDLADRRHKAWQVVLNDLLALVNSFERSTENAKDEVSQSPFSTHLNDDLVDEQLCCK